MTKSELVKQALSPMLKNWTKAERLARSLIPEALAMRFPTSASFPAGWKANLDKAMKVIPVDPAKTNATAGNIRAELLGRIGKQFKLPDNMQAEVAGKRGMLGKLQDLLTGKQTPAKYLDTMQAGAADDLAYQRRNLPENMIQNLIGARKNPMNALSSPAYQKAVGMAQQSAGWGIPTDAAGIRKVIARNVDGTAGNNMMQRVVDYATKHSK